LLTYIVLMSHLFNLWKHQTLLDKLKVLQIIIKIILSQAYVNNELDNPGSISGKHKKLCLMLSVQTDSRFHAASYSVSVGNLF
jgi:hypothetical protein